MHRHGEKLPANEVAGPRCCPGTWCCPISRRALGKRQSLCFLVRRPCSLLTAPELRHRAVCATPLEGIAIELRSRVFLLRAAARKGC